MIRCSRRKTLYKILSRPEDVFCLKEILFLFRHLVEAEQIFCVDGIGRGFRSIVEFTPANEHLFLFRRLKKGSVLLFEFPSCKIGHFDGPTQIVASATRLKKSQRRLD